ncbi:MAG TPA: hypothetical protein VM409_08795 [Chloroflexia bacterium]|nr:hypothetical protein [Chloroflexia bacterium]
MRPMCVSPNGPWAESLRQTLKRVYDPTTRTPVPWLLSGDSALALQGIYQEPDLIEFRATSQFAVVYFSQFMRPYELPANRATVVYRQGGNSAPSDGWRSNVHQKVVAWSGGGKACWLGRWSVGEFTVQVSFARTIHTDPTALAVKSGVARRVRFEGMDVAVIPLEFLLAESAQKGDTQLTHRIMHAMRAQGYSQESLRTALDVISSDKASRLLRLLDLSLVAG